MDARTTLLNELHAMQIVSTHWSYYLSCLKRTLTHTLHQLRLHYIETDSEYSRSQLSIMERMSENQILMDLITQNFAFYYDSMVQQVSAKLSTTYPTLSIKDPVSSTTPIKIKTPPLIEL